MIPAPYHFENITREAWIHPDVAAEIEAARRREGPKSPKQPRGPVALLARILPRRLLRHTWHGVPAE